jgi:hypothetical protein
MCRRSRFSRTARAASSNCNGSDDRSTRDSTSALRHTSASMTSLMWCHSRHSRANKGANASAVTERTANRVAEFMQKFLHAVTFYTSILGVSDNHDRVQVAGTSWQRSGRASPVAPRAVRRPAARGEPAADRMGRARLSHLAAVAKCVCVHPALRDAAAAWGTLEQVMAAS